MTAAVATHICIATQGCIATQASITTQASTFFILPYQYTWTFDVYNGCRRFVYRCCRQSYLQRHDTPFILLTISPHRLHRCFCSERSWMCLHGFEHRLCRDTQGKTLQGGSDGAVISPSVMWHMQQPVRQPVPQVFRFCWCSLVIRCYHTGVCRQTEERTVTSLARSRGCPCLSRRSRQKPH